MVASSQSEGNLAIDIGRIGARVHGGGGSFASELSEHYAGFAAPLGTAALDVEVEPQAVRYPAAADGPLQVRQSSGTWFFRNANVSAEWNPGRNRVVVRETSGAASIDYLLR